ncbi:MAG: hypothetical protein JXB32_16135, partial [Deltaproteobacteria bacterium]|nr:hypothetical protein [Deltaproteobacteria bacterium]
MTQHRNVLLAGALVVAALLPSATACSNPDEGADDGGTDIRDVPTDGDVPVDVPRPANCTAT